ncbi:hypothetical protein J6590_015167 [Homalodisca vitripennis]|nr:hypothetical protein J6590_015167 [Homalodisca vitripennis]
MYNGDTVDDWQVSPIITAVRARTRLMNDTSGNPSRDRNQPVLPVSIVEKPGPTVTQLTLNFLPQSGDVICSGENLILLLT